MLRDPRALRRGASNNRSGVLIGAMECGGLIGQARLSLRGHKCAARVRRISGRKHAREMWHLKIRRYRVSSAKKGIYDVGEFKTNI